MITGFFVVYSEKFQKSSGSGCAGEKLDKKTVFFTVIDMFSTCKQVVSKHYEYGKVTGSTEKSVYKAILIISGF